MVKVYISSTYSDLKSYREAVYSTLRKMDCDVIAMEDYVATDQRPLNKCLSDVGSCDLYVGIFAWCYGYIPEQENPEHKSITEMEYDQACKSSKPRLLFLLEKNTPWAPPLIDDCTGAGSGGQFIKRFRKRLEQEQVVSFFETVGDLARLVSVAVSQWKQQHQKNHSPPTQMTSKKHSAHQPFDRHPCSDASFNDKDLDQERITEFLKRDSVRRELVEQQQVDMPSIEAQLEYLGLLIGVHPTNAMLLCFARNPQKWLAGASTRYYVWKDNMGIGGFHDYREFHGNLLVQLESCMDILSNSLRFSRIITRDGSKEQCEIPLRVLEEAITNALKHREYAVRESEEYSSNVSSVHIDVFKDRIEIKSPGSLPPPLTVDNLRSENVSRPMNPVIAHVFQLYQRGERAGKGIQRMDFLMNEAGLPLPRYEQSDTQFRVILERPQQIPEEILESSEFGHQLKLGLEGIATSKKRTNAQVIAEIKDATAITNVALIEKWQHGRVPSADVVAQLAELCVQAGTMDQIWLQAFLRAAHFSEPTIEAFTAKLFPLGGSQQSLKNIIVDTLRTELPFFAHYGYATYRGHKGHVYDVAWSPDARYVASASADHTVHIWEAITGDLVFVYRDHSGRVNSVAWSPDGKHIASASNDKTVRIWNPTTGATISTYRGSSDWVNDVAWSPDGQYIASASNDKTVRIWSFIQKQEVFTHRGHSHWVHVVAWSPDGTSLASASRDKTVQIWSIDLRTCLLTYRGHTGGVNALLWSPTGKSLASGGNDKSVQVWASSTGDPGTIYKNYTSPVLSLARSPDSKRIASASDRRINLWYADTGDDIIIDSGHTGWIRAVAWSPDSMYLATGSEDKTVHIRRLFDSQEPAGSLTSQ